MNSCQFTLECSSNIISQLPTDTTNGIYQLLNYLGQYSTNSTLYDTLLPQLFIVWTFTNLQNNISKLINFLPLLGNILNLFLPGLNQLFDAYAQAFDGYLYTISYLPLINQVSSLELLLNNLQIFWSLFLEETESGVIWLRNNPSFLGSYSGLLSFFPQYLNGTRSNICHSNYNDLLGINTNVFRPISEANLKQFLKSNTRKIRIVSETSCSFNDATLSDEVTISLYYLNNIYDINIIEKTITVDAGVQLYQLSQYLTNQGWALANTGNWDQQTIGGIISTGTHGSNAFITDDFSQQIVAIYGFDSNGNYRYYDNYNHDFPVISQGIGHTLIITKVVLKILPAYSVYTLYEPNNPATIEQWLNLLLTEPHTELDYFATLDQFILRHRKFIPLGNTVIDTLKPIEDKITGFTREILTRLGSSVVNLPNVPIVNQPSFIYKNELLSGILPLLETNDTQIWFQGLSNNYVFGKSIPQAIQNSEFAFDLNNINQVYNTLKLLSAKYNIVIVYTFRTQGQSYLPMSINYGRKSLYVDIGFYDTNVDISVLKDFENTLIAIGGRPHWGKWLCLSNNKISLIYPKSNINWFKDVVEDNDPRNLLRGQFYDRVFC